MPAKAKKTTPAAAIRDELRTLDKAYNKLCRDDERARLARSLILKQIEKEATRQGRAITSALKRITTRRNILEARLAAN